VWFDKFLARIFGTANERVIKRLWPIVSEINAFEPSIKGLSDEELRAKTVEFRARIAQVVAEQTRGIDDREEKRRRRPQPRSKPSMRSSLKPLP
jgi:preprotein translocase subunit SecA